MPSPEELLQQQRDAKRVLDENAKAIVDRKAVLRKRQAEIAQHKADLSREHAEVTRELSGL